MEQTLSIIKPDGVERNLIGSIVAKFEEAGLRIAAMKKKHLSRREAEAFYAVHSERPFFGELVDFMTRSPVVVMFLKAKMQSLVTVRSWVQQTLQKLLTALSVNYSLSQSAKTLFTVLTLQKQLKKK